MYLQSLHFTSLYLPAYLCGKLIKMTETLNMKINENFVSQKRTGKRFFSNISLWFRQIKCLWSDKIYYFIIFFTIYEIICIKIVKIYWKQFISLKTSISCTFIRCHWAFWSSILVFEWTGCFGASNRLSFPVARNFCSVFILVKHQPIYNFMLNFSSNYIYKYSWRRQYDWQG